ncbi:hypothetical protein D3C72_1838240 [compost metagenome]
MAEDEHLDTLAHALECRDGGQHGEGHGHHRHHREQRGVGQRSGIVGAAIGEKALQQKAPEFQPIVQALTHALSLAINSRPRCRPQILNPVQTKASTRLE